MREILRLVGTKWNIGTFYPGFGTGGYCIPLSSRYVIDGVKDETKLSLLRETIKTDSEINVLIAQSFIKRKFKNIGVLGLSYKGNLKVGILSPVIPFVNEIKKYKINIKLFDPYFTSEEIKDIVNLETFKFPEELNQFDALVIAVNHNSFIIDNSKIYNYLINCKYILDNFGIWKNLGLTEKGIEYHISGDENWLN